ncbi:MAG: UDP-N-acetylglucosamine 2-epimerase (non-hydrolyzing) [Flammeovirgaceae bacterium]|jgi:UDP-N-acetylglucosamine 2-epimerase (non-hydrolysing)|nr:UDP-N-acetylglucosamine 2-epimerase (non-hydrolyzing) [Flammeovirgaceae bacterium]
MRIDIIAGARPNFMKIAPIIDAIRIRQLDGSRLSFRLVHTGQHYDKAMSGRFFEELNIPDPEINLEVGSGTQAEQTGNIMVRYEKLLMDSPCDLCLVVGDVTSTMACSIAAKKLNIKVAHVEGGIRSFDLTMPEEINRMVTDSITDYFFTTSEVANQNLIKEGVDPTAIFFVGNTMIDTLLKNQSRFSQPPLWNDLNLKEKEYIILTLHRPSNVDTIHQLQNLLNEITLSAKHLPVIFPVHPRTRKTLLSANLSWANLFCVDPLGYLEFNYLVKHAKAVITDSGGVTEETTVLGVPCMTLRTSTERPETVTMGTNELLGIDPNAIRPAMQKVFEGNWKQGTIPEKWDGEAAGRIVTALEKVLSV